MIRFGFCASLASRHALMSTAIAPTRLSCLTRRSPSPWLSDLPNAFSAPAAPVLLWMITWTMSLLCCFACCTRLFCTKVVLAMPLSSDPPNRDCQPWEPIFQLPRPVHLTQPLLLEFGVLPLPPFPANAAIGASRTKAATRATTAPRPPRPHRALERCSPPRFPVPQSA